TFFCRLHGLKMAEKLQIFIGNKTAVSVKYNDYELILRQPLPSISRKDSSTFFWSIDLKFVSFLDIALSFVAMICADRIPAFFAPLSATVATGTPDGICKIER